MGKIYFSFVLVIIASCQMDSKNSRDASGATKDTAVSQDTKQTKGDAENLKPGANMAHVISKDGTKVAFEKAGSGHPVIIVSGALSQRDLFRDQARSLIEKLSKHFTVITYDRRGRGQSTDVQPYSVDREIEDIESLVDQVAGGRAYLYGVSSGAALALQTAAKLGAGKVSKLAMYEPPYGQEKQAFDKQKQGIAERVQKGEPGEAAAFFMTENGTPPEVFERMKSSPEWETMKQIDSTLVYDYEVLGSGKIPKEVTQQITIPALVMDGEKSMDFMHATAGEMARLIRGAQHKMLKGQMHEVEAQVMGPVLIDFFGEVPTKQ